MSRVFFGKFNVAEQVNEKIFRTNKEGLLGDIKKGDYAFVKLAKETNPATVKRLWKLKDIKQINDECLAYFDEVCQFKPIPLLKFEALDLFVLDMNLLNKCNKITPDLSFVNLAITDDDFFNKLVNAPESFKNYIENMSHYRKIVKVVSKEQVDNDSIDVQIYNDGQSWFLAESSFIGDDLKENFDSSQYDLFGKYGCKGSNSAKDKMFSFLAGSDIDVPMMGLLDLFCGTVNINSSIPIKIRGDFIQYCKDHNVTNAAKQYESGIRRMERELLTNVDQEYAKDNCETLLNKIEQHKNEFTKDNIGSRKDWNSYLRKYIDYKKSLPANPNIVLPITGNNINTTYDYSQANFLGENKVFYGTPGCGKSYYLENGVLKQEGIDENSVFRTTFFQDYSNTDFVGQILPQVSSDKTVTYEFVPGPFTLALKYAIDNPNKKVALIIEELNRGNAPSIFGDIFQLLDRKDGESRYSIVNVNIQSYLKKESPYELNYIKIPSNLYIYATMNTNDQNVFTLDTAFKRRWKFERISNDFSRIDTIGDKYVPGFKNITWKVFVKTINEFIINNATSLSAEDKQLGKYFIDEDLLMDSMEDYSDDKLKEFANKVFEYLWSDVAKFNRSDWFVSDIKSLNTLIYRFSDHASFFSEELAKKLPLYVPVEEEE